MLQKGTKEEKGNNSNKRVIQDEREKKMCQNRMKRNMKKQTDDTHTQKKK